MKIKNILLTGSMGYIGMVLKKYLEKLNYNILDLDLKIYSELDIRKKQNIDVYHDIDLVIHLAGIVGEPNCQLDINDTYKTNVDGTNNIIQFCKEKNIPLIFASTCSVYGKKSGIVTEKANSNPIGIYAITKMMCEQKIKEELDNYIICRFGTVYGDSPSMKFDLVINGMTQRAYEEGVVTVFGGKQHRPFISTEELSKTICKLVKEFEKGKQKQIYNCVAFNKTILDIGKEISKIVKTKMNVNPKFVVKELQIDERDYAVSNEKISKIYKPKNTMKKEVRKIWKKLQKNEYK